MGVGRISSAPSPITGSFAGRLIVRCELAYRD